ncbi:MAG: tetratricopeptide repeat protein, partial [Candidatus Aureabacteria bacterium]|nr:tetratricopeptide repeat protein [Candidatus Auribacterota bacterium]
LDAPERTITLARLRTRIVLACAMICALALAPLSFFRSIKSEISLSRGLQKFHAGDTGAAEGEFARAVQWRPENGRARFFLGLCYSTKGRHADAVREMRAALSTYRRQAIYLALGKEYGMLGDREESGRYLDMARSILPRDADAWVEKGNLLFGRGDNTGAISCYRQAILAQPGHAAAARNLAISHHAMGRLDEAIAAYERAIPLNPGDVDIYVNMGAIYAQRGDRARARELWMKALSVAPGNPRAKENLKRLEGESAAAPGN